MRSFLLDKPWAKSYPSEKNSCLGYYSRSHRWYCVRCGSRTHYWSHRRARYRHPDLVVIVDLSTDPGLYVNISPLRSCYRCGSRSQSLPRYLCVIVDVNLSVGISCWISVSLSVSLSIFCNRISRCHSIGGGCWVFLVRCLFGSYFHRRWLSLVRCLCVSICCKMGKHLWLVYMNFRGSFCWCSL